MERVIKELAMVLLAISLATAAHAQDYDVVINNGRVMDPETRYNAIANVGVKDGKIAVITKKKITGKETIDATGHVVAAGFIDTHFHWTRPLGYKLALRDGVTTPMDLEAGALGTKVAEWYDMHHGKSQVNYGTGSGHELARIAVMEGVEAIDASEGVAGARGSGTDWIDKVASLEEGNRLLQIIDAGLQQGALGVASTLGYMPGATAREMFEIQKVASRYGRFTASIGILNAILAPTLPAFNP